jgi:GNAT superfamily N-acetyltransferase
MKINISEVIDLEEIIECIENNNLLLDNTDDSAYFINSQSFEYLKSFKKIELFLKAQDEFNNLLGWACLWNLEDEIEIFDIDDLPQKEIHFFVRKEYRRKGVGREITKFLKSRNLQNTKVVAWDRISESFFINCDFENITYTKGLFYV